MIHSGEVTSSTTAQGLWDNAARYFKWCDENPINIKKTIPAGKSVGTVFFEEHPRPYTVKGLCLHCGVTERYLNDCKRNTDVNNEFYVVVNRILYIIFSQNQEFAMIGEYSPIFTMKVLGLDRPENNMERSPARVEIITGLPELKNSEQEILEKLDFGNVSDYIAEDKKPER